MKKVIWLLLACFVFLTVSSALAEEKAIEIKHLGVAPWLGPFEKNEQLATKFAPEKANLAAYVQFDLKRSAGVDVTYEQAKTFVDAMEASIVSVSARDVTYKDGKEFLSMGWKSRGIIQRTPRNVLKRGKPTKGISLGGEIGEYEVSYFFPKECGNPMLDKVEKAIPPKAEAVPLPRAEASPPPPLPVVIQPPPPAPAPRQVVVDVCPNIEGIQTAKPEGLVYEGGVMYDNLTGRWGNCVLPPQLEKVVEKVVYVQNSVVPSYPTYSPRYDYQPTYSYQPQPSYNTNGYSGGYSSDALVGALVGGVAGYALGSARHRDKNTVVVNVDNHNDIGIDTRASSNSMSSARNDNSNWNNNDNRNDIRSRFDGRVDGRNDVIVVPDRRRDDRRDDRVIFPPVVRTVSPVAPPVVRTLGSSGGSWSGTYTPSYYQGSGGTYAYRGGAYTPSGNRNGDDRRGRGRGSNYYSSSSVRTR